MRTANETMLTVVLGALGVYFSVLNGRGLLRYAQFRRVRPHGRPHLAPSAPAPLPRCSSCWGW